MPTEAVSPDQACTNDRLACHPFPSAWLPADIFSTIVAHTPLVSIDLIVEDAQSRILLGRRRNQPAQDYWFVPGGRIRKLETLDAAFLRLAQEELGITVDRKKAILQGVYEHFYDSDFSGSANRSTHYVVLAYRLRLDRTDIPLPPQQHSEYQWVDEDRVTHLASVHPYTLSYFTTA